MKRISTWIYRLIAVLALLGAASFSHAPAAPAAPAAQWQSKVDAWVLDSAAQGKTEFLLFLTEQADLSGAARLATKAEKGAYVYEQLSRTAARTQAPLLAELERRGAQHRAYWVANMVWVRGDAALVQAMAQRSDVAHIYANPWVQQAPPEPAASQIESTTAIEWNILKVRADQVWAAGYTGQGAVIAGQDTGYDWDHAALKQQYRGWDGAAADHNYSWHDAIHEDMLPYTPPGNPCGFDSPVPCDDHGHGTHTMGTMVGDDGGSNQIGMAPGARWIGCRNMEQGWGSPTTYSECYQWFIAPTDLNGQNPRPELAPDVINNSWGCTVAEGCSDPNALKTVVENVRAAGILTVSSAGNLGSACSSINQPAAIYAASFTVGATDSSDLIASFSSRGPVIVDGSGRLKPDISAPGAGVRSSYPNDTYVYLNGTSMAAPHVAGLVGLLISAAPHLAGQVDLLESLITGSAVPRTTSQNCGTVPGSAVPNNTYGYGRIDALSALNVLLGNLHISKISQPDTVIPGGLITYTLSISYTGYLEQIHMVTISDTLPAQTSFVSASDGYTLSDGAVRWTFPSISTAPEHHVRLVVAVDPDAAGAISNDAYRVQSQEVPSDNGSPIITPVLSYSLSPAQQSFVFVTAGSVLTHTHWLTNTSIISQSFHLALASSQGWAAFVPGTAIDLSLAAGDAVPIQIRVAVPPDAPVGQVEETTLTVSTLGEPVQQRTVTSSTQVMLLLYLPVIQRE